MRRFNLHTGKTEYDESDPEGFQVGMARFGSSIGATLLGGSLYELPPGQSNCPYHYEYGNEEWLLVLDGKLTVRHPGGEEELEPGDVVCFSDGPDGAHRLTNRTDATVRILMLSTLVEPSVSVYPDSDKIGVWPGDDRDNIIVRRKSNVDYWDGENGWLIGNLPHPRPAAQTLRQAAPSPLQPRLLALPAGDGAPWLGLTRPRGHANYRPTIQRWRGPGSNRRHHGFQPCALPTELPRLAVMRV